MNQDGVNLQQAGSIQKSAWPRRDEAAIEPLHQTVSM